MLLDYCAGDGVLPKSVLKPCPVHPFGKVYSYCNCCFISYAAATDVLFFRARLQDSWEDERSVAALTGKAFFCRSGRKASRAFSSLSRTIAERLTELQTLEKSGTDSVDAAAEPFAVLLAAVFSMDGLLPARLLPDLKNLGYHLGKWIYLADAAEDREKDRRHKSFNVYNNRYGAEKLPESELLNREFCLAKCAESWECLKEKVGRPEDDRRGYLDNLFYLGLYDSENRLRQGKERKEALNG